MTGLNGSGRSPRKLDIDYVRQRGITGPRIPWQDINSVTVPGTFRLSTISDCRQSPIAVLGCAALWVDTIEVFGTLKIADVLKPAIQLAEGGFVPLTLHASALASL